MPHIELPDGEVMKEHEARVLRLVFQGQKAQQIAEALSLKRGTVEAYKYNVYQKLETHNVSQTRRRLEERRASGDRDGGKIVPGYATASGSRNLTRVPIPSRLDKSMVPPCVSNDAFADR